MDSLARFLGPLCVALLILGSFTGTAAAVDESATGRLIVELEADGDANVVLTDEYDLTDAEQRTAFENVRNNETLRQRSGSRFREGMQSLSGAVNEEVDRELRVGEVTVGTTVDGETGIVGYQSHWENLARVDGDRIVLSEPFSAYAGVDQELVVVAPEGGEFTSVSPQPHRAGEEVVGWSGGAALGEDFEVVATGPEGAAEEATEEPTERFSDPDETYGGGPIALGVSALLLASLFVGRKR
jgi:hypothetical protein